MKKDKLNALFAAARADRAPEAPAGFDQRVIAGLAKREPQPGGVPLWSQLESGFGRYAVAAAVVILLCGAGELRQRTKAGASLSDQIEQLYLDETIE